ncbi:MAG TPA: type I methionyl aminopeptidase [Alphaproteobacteria bacterium]|nr:type I methionyl aminopeptidase [Alphaproteobacteria bacterium]
MHDHTNCCDHDHDHEERTITIHKPEDFEGMRRAGRLACQVLDFITPSIKAGISTDEINTLCHDFMTSKGGFPAPLGYHGYPKSVCTSVNHVVCHGIPGDKKLETGDIINVDVTVLLDGWHGDTSRTFGVGKIGLRAQKLIDVTYESLMRAIEIVKPGITLGDIGHTIQTYAQKHGFSVVRDFCGHGIGRQIHSYPNVMHYGKPCEGHVLEEGMFFTIEPMINAGRYDVKILNDGWTAVTKDKSLSAQFEHSLGVTATGHEIFTI